MENASSSDYMEIKKRKQIIIVNPERSASSYTSNKQYVVLQTTASLDYDECLENSTRFNVSLPSTDLAILSFPSRRTYPMFSIPRK
jgi:hypothetical protein